MSSNSRNAVRNNLLETVADSSAAQWAALGGLPRALGGEGATETGEVVDPEALVLLSLLAREVDPRLEERLAWWARVGARYTNLQRMRTLVGQLPQAARLAWKSFAREVASHGRVGWETHAGAPTEGTLGRRRRGEADEPRLVGTGALILRMRAAFGVTAKVDILSFLLASGGGAPLPASEIARELAFSESTTKRAARDMARARLIRATPGHPVEYGLDREAWRSVLELGDEVPRWRPWARVLPFVAEAIEWAGADAAGSPDLRASRARDLVEGAETTLLRWGLRVPDPERHPAEAFEPVFLDLLDRLSESLRSGA